MMSTVFFGRGSGIWKWIFADVLNDNSVECCDFENKCNSRILAALLSVKISRHIPHFIQRIIYRYVLKYDFLSTNRKTEYLFAFTNGFEMFGDPQFYYFIDFIKKEFPYGKFALHYLESLHHCYPDQLPAIKERFDLILGFDRYDVERYGIEYYGALSENHDVEPTGDVESSDLFYTGGASTHDGSRFNLVANIFKELTDKGKKCIFFMVGLESNWIEKFCQKIGKEAPDGVLEYGPSKFYFNLYCPYSRSLSYIMKTKAMLEVILPVGMQSCTCRLPQAMTYGIKLVTNSRLVNLEPYYREENILMFDKPEDINTKFWETEFQTVNYDFTAMSMIHYMEQRLFGPKAERDG